MEYLSQNPSEAKSMSQQGYRVYIYQNSLRTPNSVSQQINADCDHIERRIFIFKNPLQFRPPQSECQQVKTDLATIYVELFKNPSDIHTFELQVLEYYILT